MLNCKNASKLISQSLDRKLNFNERLQLRFHLFICRACTLFNQNLILICKSVKSMTRFIEDNDSIKLSEEAKENIKKAIDRH